MYTKCAGLCVKFILQLKWSIQNKYSSLMICALVDLWNCSVLYVTLRNGPLVFYAHSKHHLLTCYEVRWAAVISNQINSHEWNELQCHFMQIFNYFVLRCHLHAWIQLQINLTENLLSVVFDFFIFGGSDKCVTCIQVRRFLFRQQSV